MKQHKTKPVYMYKEDLLLEIQQCYKTTPNQTKPIYMYKGDLALKNLQWLLCHKAQPNQILYI